jgi:flagellar motor component MotA
MSNDEYVKALHSIIERALIASEKARREGLLALEEFIDDDKADNRDIFKYGMRFVVDGTDNSFIDKILANIIKQEKDETQLLLKTIQKEAVLAIHEGENPVLLAALLNSYTNLPLDDPVFKDMLEGFCR